MPSFQCTCPPASEDARQHTAGKKDIQSSVDAIYVLVAQQGLEGTGMVRKLTFGMSLSTSLVFSFLFQPGLLEPGSI